MSDSKDTTGVPELDGSNYDVWKLRVLLHLRNKDLETCVLNKVTYKAEVQPEEGAANVVLAAFAAVQARNKALRKADLDVQTAIVKHVSDSQIELVRGHDTAYDMWRSLLDKFERGSTIVRLKVYRELGIMKEKCASMSMASRFSAFDKLIRELRTAGAQPQDDDIICWLLLSLPTEYSMVVTAIETLPQKHLKLAAVRNRLLDEEVKLTSVANSAQPESAFRSTAVPSRGGRYPFRGRGFCGSRGRGGQPRGFPFPCHSCGKSDISGLTATSTQWMPTPTWESLLVPVPVPPHNPQTSVLQGEQM